MNIHDLNTLSLHELHELVANAERVLKERQKEARKGVMAQIRALADEVGLTVTFQEEGPATRASSRKGGKVAAKYRNPDNPAQTWTGRGVKPRWLQSLLDQGRDISEFTL